MKHVIQILLLVAVTACAGYSGGGLVVGQASREDVIRAMGEPAMQWTEADGSQQLAYPRGPMGVHTYMARIRADGKLLGIENVMTPLVFSRVQPHMTTEDVLRLLGPSVAAWSDYFKARDELVWGWRYCDEWNHLARFFVLFDGATKTVRSTMMLGEEQTGNCGSDQGGWSYARNWCMRES
jgi:hypothetical protein